MMLHHLNCVSACPLGGRLMDGRSPSIFQRGCLCCHCILAESKDGLVLVDTGYGLQDVRSPSQRLSSMFLWMMSPDFREEMTAVRQIEHLGFKAEEVRHIVLTHLDFDHAGGLDDFPAARVHLMRREGVSAAMQATWLDRQRYRPQQWASRSRWHLYEATQGGLWYGFHCARELDGLKDDVFLVPLHGHTLGHAGVALRADGRWVLMAGDAYFYHEEMDPVNPRCTPGLRMYQTLMEKDRKARLANQRHLRDLKRDHGSEIDILSSHDPEEFERVAGRAANTALGI